MFNKWPRNERVRAFCIHLLENMGLSCWKIRPLHCQIRDIGTWKPSWCHFTFLVRLTDNPTSPLALAARVHADGVSPCSTKGVLSSGASPVVGVMTITASMVPVPNSRIFKVGNNQASGVLGGNASARWDKTAIKDGSTIGTGRGPASLHSCVTALDKRRLSVARKDDVGHLFRFMVGEVLVTDHDRYIRGRCWRSQVGLDAKGKQYHSTPSEISEGRHDDRLKLVKMNSVRSKMFKVGFCWTELEGVQMKLYST